MSSPVECGLDLRSHGVVEVFEWTHRRRARGQPVRPDQEQHYGLGIDDPINRLCEVDTRPDGVYVQKYLVGTEGIHQCIVEPRGEIAGLLPAIADEKVRTPSRMTWPGGVGEGHGPGATAVLPDSAAGAVCRTGGAGRVGCTSQCRAALLCGSHGAS